MLVLDHLLSSLRRCFDAFPDRRKGARPETQYAMADFGMAAFSVFFMQSPSFLAHQKRLEEGHGRSNCATLFGITEIPCASSLRRMLDPATPDLLHPAFADVLAEIERGDGLYSFRRLGGHVLIALDGTEYHSSYEIHCPHCSTRKRSNSKTEYFHSMLAATVVAPGRNRVIPLEPEFIVPQDGADKQDSEIAAAKRWLKAHGEHYARLHPIFLGDDLFAHQPFCEAVLASGGHFLFTCKPATHTLIQEYITGVELPTHQVTVKRGKTRVTHRYRWLGDVPLRNGKDALHVNWFEFEIVDATGKVTYRNSFITNLPITKQNVEELAECGRARWKIENETFNVVKTKGYNLEHNFGHGKENLSLILVALNLLAFAIHTACDLRDELWQRVRTKLATRRRFFSDLAAITSYLIFSSWTELLQTLGFERPPPRPP